MTWVPAAAALVVWWAAPSAPAASAASAAPTAPQGLLQEAQVRVAVVGDAARVAARYRITDAGDSVRFHAPRPASQSLEFDRRLRDPRLRLDSLPGMFRLTVAGRGRMTAVELRYLVRGDLSRIPLFVPQSPTTPGQRRISIRMTSLSPERVARFTVPRFTAGPGGAWLAQPDHLPGVIAVVRGNRRLPVPALAQWSVLLAVIGGTLGWVLAQAKARRRA